MTFQIVQGVEMGRKRHWFVDVNLTTDTAGQREVDTVHIGGKTVNYERKYFSLIVDVTTHPVKVQAGVAI